MSGVSSVTEALQLCSLAETAGKTDAAFPSLEQLMAEQARIIAEFERMGTKAEVPQLCEPSQESVEKAEAVIRDASIRLHDLSLLLDTTWSSWTKEPLAMKAEIDGNDLQRLLRNLEIASQSLSAVGK